MFFLFGLRFEFFLVLWLLSDGFCWVNKSLFDVLLGDEPWHMDCKRKKNYKTWIIKFRFNNKKGLIGTFEQLERFYFY